MHNSIYHVRHFLRYGSTSAQRKHQLPFLQRSTDVCVAVGVLPIVWGVPRFLKAEGIAVSVTLRRLTAPLRVENEELHHRA